MSLYVILLDGINKHILSWVELKKCILYMPKIRMGRVCCILLRPHDDVIKGKHFPRYWPFVLGIHRSPMNSAHTGQWRWALMASLICAWINGWVNNREAGDLRRHRTHYDVIVMLESIHHDVPGTPLALKQPNDFASKWSNLECHGLMIYTNLLRLVIW